MEREVAARRDSVDAAGNDHGAGSRYTIERRGRLWALLEGNVLVCVTAYRKGAMEVRRRLEGQGR